MPTDASGTRPAASPLEDAWLALWDAFSAEIAAHAHHRICSDCALPHQPRNGCERHRQMCRDARRLLGIACELAVEAEVMTRKGTQADAD